MADMVPDEIEPAEGVGRAPHDAAGEFVLAQIASQAERAASGAGDLGNHGIDPGLIDVHYPDRSTFAGEAERAGPPHAGSCCGDYADLALEPHGLLPFFRSGGNVLDVVERVERGTVGVADHMTLDLQGRRHLTVGDRKRFRRNREAPDPFDR